MSLEQVWIKHLFLANTVRKDGLIQCVLALVGLCGFHGACQPSQLGCGNLLGAGGQLVSCLE